MSAGPLKTVELPDEAAEAALVEHWQLTGVPDTGAHTLRRSLAAPAPPIVDGELPPVLGPGADFDLNEKIAEGGMAEIHLGTQRSVGRSVALKIVKRAAQSPHARQQLLREARIAGSLEHPNIIPVHTVGLDGNGEPVLVMKRIEGISWREYMAGDGDRRMVPGETALDRNVRVLMEVAKGVHFAHSRGVVHRDLKPDNVMIGQFGDVYLLDWGIAVDYRKTPKPSGVAGTPGYMAPEMVGEKAVDPRTDGYLLGALLYELLTGEPPHGAQSVYGAMLKAWRGVPPEFPDDAPSELVEVCRKAMARDPEDRFRDVQAFRQACAAFLRHQGSHALATNAASRQRRLVEAIEASEAGSSDHTTIYRYFGAARFGFEQALHSWAGNETARAGLAECLGIMARFELAHDNASGAEALLDELSAMGRADLALTQSIARARSHQTQTEQELVTLRLMADALDPEVGARARSRVAAGLAVLLSALALFSGWFWRSLFGGEIPALASVTHGIAWSALTLFVLWRFRDTLMQNRASRQLAITAMWLVIGGLFIRLLSAIGQVRFYDAFPLEFAFYAVTIGLMGYNRRPRFDFAAAPMCVGAIAMAIWPEWLFEWTAGTVFLTLSTMAIVWHPRFARSPKAPATPDAEPLS